MSNSQDNKRIAKNTLMLYFRMLFTMSVSLYTSRIVLNTLGVSDYGIYNVVGGVITMFTFLNGAMASATQRYLNFGLAKNDLNWTKSIFRTAMQIHIMIALVILLLAETVGLWFVMNKLVIPADRITAAMWVYQFSVITCMVSIISLPYNADIIAHERMNAFAYISIMDVTIKLLLVYLIQIVETDKLILYALFFLFVQLLDQAIYNFYCKHHFPEVNFSFKYNKVLFKEMSSFAGWSLWGNIAGILFTQGVNILLNIFFGPTVNAARGVAVQVQSVISGFVVNIQMALNPQITKSYAKADLNRMHSLMFASSKFCFFMLFLIVLPLSIEAKDVLTFWLKIVPDHTVWFLRLIIFVMLTETLANPYIIANQATGKVKIYQAVCGGLLLLIVPIAYLVLKLGGSPESVFIVHGCIAIVTQIARVYLMRNLINISIGLYLRKIILPILSVALLSPILPIIVHNNVDDGLLHFLIVCLISIVSVILSSYYLGLSALERTVVQNKVASLIVKTFRK